MNSSPARRPTTVRRVISSIGCTFSETIGSRTPSLSVRAQIFRLMAGSPPALEAEAGGTVVLFTGDRDMFQCVSDQVAVLFPGGKDGPTLIDEAGVKERYGIRPDQVPDFIALRGDPSDGLPGARGIGEKTARELLAVHGTLEDAIANARAERPRVAAALRDQAEELREFKEIATLVHVPLEQLADRPTDFAGGAAAARRLGLERLAA